MEEKKELKDPLFEDRPRKEQEVVPPDGGFWAWLVMTACFLTNGIIFGIINTFGVLFVKLRSDMEEAGEEDAAFKCSLVGSLTIGFTFFFSFVVGVIADKIGLRTTAVLGGVIATLGMGISTYFYQSIEVLYFSYGVLFGTGSSLAYTPSLTILGHYFKKHMGFVNGIVTAGSSVFTILLSILNTYILEHHGLHTCLLMFTGMSAVLILAGMTFIPVLPPHPPSTQTGGSKVMALVEKLIYLDNWRNKRYVIWALAIPSALFGYFVPYVHLPQFAKMIPLSPEKASSLVGCIGITSGLGRIIFGKVADFPRIQANGNRVVLQQIAFISIGICTMLLNAAPYFGQYTYQALMFFCCLMGLFDGCFITMLGPIAFDICDHRGAGQAIGFLLTLCSVPLTLGPPIAGLIYDKLGNYFVAFIGAGVPPIVGALLMLFIRKFPAKSATARTETTDALVEKA